MNTCLFQWDQEIALVTDHLYLHLCLYKNRTEYYVKFLIHSLVVLLIGFKSATLELKVLVAYILHNFEVHSERSMNDLTQAIRKQIMPFPDFDIKMYPRY